MCKKVVYQTAMELRAMEQELRRLKQLQISQKEQQLQTQQSSCQKQEDIYKQHFVHVGEILGSSDPEHERDELCWVGDKQISVNGEIAKLNMSWINANNKLHELKRDHEPANKTAIPVKDGPELANKEVSNLKNDFDLTKESAVYKEFFDNAKKVTAAIMGAAGQAPLIIDFGGEVTEMTPKLTIEEVLANKDKDGCLLPDGTFVSG